MSQIFTAILALCDILAYQFIMEKEFTVHGLPILSEMTI